MAAVTPTAVKNTEFGGDYKLAMFTFTPGAASDTLTFTLATHGFSEITGIISVALTAGTDVDLLTIQATVSGLVVTVTTYNAAGTAATDWTSAAARITLLVK